jgi:hypothetical protein
VPTTINIGHPLFNTRDEWLRIHALLKHLGSGGDLGAFPATASEKVALVKTASQRKLIAWHKGRNRYELTAAGWCELAPSRRFGVGSMVLGTTAGATLGAVALAVFWFAAGPSHGQHTPRATVAAAPAQQHVATLSRPAVDGALNSAAPLTPPAPVQTAAPAAMPVAAPPALPTHEVAPAAAPPVVAEPTNVAEQPTPEQLEAAAKAKQIAAKKARQKAAARRRREEAARAWAAAEPSRTGLAAYGYGGRGGYGGQSSWFAYR